MADAKLLTKKSADVNACTRKGRIAAEIRIHSGLTDYSGSILNHNCYRLGFISDKTQKVGF